MQKLTLMALARNRRLLFVEGANDYKLIRRFAWILDYDKLAAGRGVTIAPSGGFDSWSKIKNARRQALTEIDVLAATAITPTIDEPLTNLGPYCRKRAVGQRNHQ